MNQQREKILNFQCQNCGGTIKWNIARQRLECDICGKPFIPENSDAPVLEHDFQSYAALERETLTFPGQTVITCSSCGTQVVFGPQDTAAVCPMCGSSQITENRQITGVPPDGLVPFRVDKELAEKLFHQWVTSLSFAPGQLKQSYQLGKLVGVYLPFWTFDLQAEAQYSGEGGDNYTDSDGDTRTSWTTVNGCVSAGYDDFPVCAATGPVLQLIDKILPYSTQKGAVPYHGAYLSGFPAQRYFVKADTALGRASEQIKKYLTERAKEQIKSHGHDDASVKRLDLSLFNVGYKHMLLPAWVSSFVFNGKQYLYLINGETGKIAGKRPYSILKILAACLVGVTIIAWIVSLFL